MQKNKNNSVVKTESVGGRVRETSQGKIGRAFENEIAVERGVTGLGRATLLLLAVTNRPNGHRGTPEIEIERFFNGQRG